MAQVHLDIQKFASSVKAIAKSHIAARTAESDQAALAKIEAMTTQSHHRITMLKQKTIEHINSLKSRVNELEGQFRKEMQSLQHRLLSSKQLSGYCGTTVSHKIS